MDHTFQINLGGLIDLLSNHLYSGPEVFVRELLQNAVDAIRACVLLDPDHAGEIHLEVHPAKRGKAATLAATDNGVGLTADEVHRFLATIGSSSKKGRPADFIGQFGIGILSCFVVSDEIVVLSRSAKGGAALEWRAKPDGTYTLREVAADLPAGTQVYLTGKKEHADLFTAERVGELARHYGGLLPYPVRVVSGKHGSVVNEGGAPWRQEYATDKERTRALLAFGREAFEQDFFDAVPMRSEAGDVDGVAFVLPHAVNLSARKEHRVYLKNMLLSETADNLLPDWAVFVKAVVNANDLRPTASRESFYDDAKLRSARAALGECVRQYLVTLARRDPRRLEEFVALHHLALKALAAEDDEFFGIIIDHLPFETSLGRMTFGEYRKQNDAVRFAPTVDGFRQIAGVAAAQGLCVLNAGYVHDTDLMRKAADAFPDLPVEAVDPTALAQTFEELTLAEREAAHALLAAADVALRPFKCAAEARKFEPKDVPALYTETGEGRFLRSVERSKEVATPLFGGVLDSLGRSAAAAAACRLCFNFSNPLVRRLAEVGDKRLLRRAAEMLYVQALLMGHHPLSGREMRLLNDGLLGLIELGVAAEEAGRE